MVQFITYIVEKLIEFVTYFIALSGYLGIFVLMALESTMIPLPSELVMPFAGYLAYQGQFNFFLICIDILNMPEKCSIKARQEMCKK